MTTYFLVKSNIRHNGTNFERDTIISGELSEFKALVDDGALYHIKGAKSEEEAKELLAELEADKEEEAGETEPEDTWGAKPDAPEVPVESKEEAKEPVDYDGPMSNYKITGEAPYNDEQGNPKGMLEIGTIYELPKPVGDAMVESGVAEEVIRETGTVEVSTEVKTEETTPEETGENL